MEASIREPNLKNFIRLLQCASKFGDDLNIHATKDQLQWELAVTNSSRSAFCLFKLRRSFFCRYKAHGTASAQRKGISCQLLVKSVLAVLGKSGSTNNVDRLDLTIVDPDQALGGRKRSGKSTGTSQSQSKDDDDAEYEEGQDEEPELAGIEAKLIMKLVCKHGVTKKHSLHLGTSEFLRAEVDPNSTPSSFTISARTLRDMLDHFAIVAPTGMGSAGGLSVRSENNLGWMFTRREVRIKSWEGTQTGLTTEIKVDPGEFDDYYIEDERVDLTIPMKEFKAALSLAEQLSISLNVAFSEATQPVTVVSRLDEMDDGTQGAFDIFCAIATTGCEAFKDIPTDRKPSRTPSGNHFKADAQVNGAAGPSTSKRQAGDDARRSSSAQPQKKQQRTKLNMSTVPGSQQNISVVINSMSESLARDTVPGSDQAEEVDLNVGEDAPMGSQTQRLTQKEVLDITGLGNEADLAELLDVAEDEDEAEEVPPEAQRGATIGQAGHGAAQDGEREQRAEVIVNDAREHNERLEDPTRHGVEERQEDRENVPPRQEQEISAFEPDPAVFQDVMDQQDGTEGFDAFDELESTQKIRGTERFDSLFDD